MPIQVRCNCGKMLSVKDDFAGRKVKCPACQKLLRVPAAEEFAEDEIADEPTELPQKSRGGEKSTSRGKGSKKGKKSSGSGGGLLIGLGTGGGLLVVALLAWMLWPSKPDGVADAPADNTVGTPATGGTSGTATPPATVPVAPTGGMASHTGSPSAVVTTTPKATTPAPAPVLVPATPLTSTNPPAKIAIEVTGDLKTLQGDWHVMEVQADPPAPAQATDEAKKMAFTLTDDEMTVWQSKGRIAFTIKLDSTQNPKTIDLIPRAGQQPGLTLLGIYSIEGETLNVVLRLGFRPTSFKLEPGLMQGSIVLNRGRPVGLENAQIPVDKFDYKAWQAAEGQLQAMKVRAEMNSVMGEPGYAEGVTHIVGISPPDTADGTMSPELWAIVSSLSHVMIRTVCTTDATLEQASRHPGLVGLNLSGRFSVTPAGISHLKTCFHLRGLYFSEIPVSAELITAATQLSQMRQFGIYKSPVSGEMLMSITQMNQLESLSLQEAGITDADALQIAKLTKLKSLLLNGSKITDTGLQTLQSLKDLTHFDVRGLAVTPQAVAEFEAALPKCKVFK